MVRLKLGMEKLKIEAATPPLKVTNSPYPNACHKVYNLHPNVLQLVGTHRTEYSYAIYVRELDLTHTCFLFSCYTHFKKIVTYMAR